MMQTKRRHLQSRVSRLAGAAALTGTMAVLLATTLVQADMGPNPEPFEFIESDGSHSGALWVKGRLDEYIWLEDENSMTVIHDEETGNDYYAYYDDVTGEVRPDYDCRVTRDGTCDARKKGYNKRQKPSTAVREQTTGKFGRKARRSKLHPKILRYKARKRQKKMNQQKGLGRDYDPNRRALRSLRGLQGDGEVLKNMVILLRFSNHFDRQLPTEAQYEQLFNAKDAFLDPAAHPNCDTGSVRDCFRVGSHGDLDLDSEIFGWLTLPQTEAYYVDGYYGVTGRLQQEGLAWGLNQVQDILHAQGRSFAEFDQDGDGWIDSITFIHSGYDAAAGGADCYGTSPSGRVWSHKWAIPGDWRSAESVKVGDYHINAGLWGTCNSDIARIGVIW